MTLFIGFFVLIFLCAFAGASVAILVFGRRAGSEGIREYLDRKEDELNEKIKRKSF